VTGSKKRRHSAVRREDPTGRDREEAQRRARENADRERTREISTAVRIVLMIWEIVWTLIRDHVITGTGPGRFR
jgi:hypothetical protein